jgi:peptidyl-tRNA hydrolase
MRKGKMCAMASHASMKVFFDRLTIFKEDEFLTYTQLYDSYGALNIISHSFTPEMVDWMNGIFKKIVVSCDSEEELLYLYERAKDKRIPSAIIEDNGLTEFNCAHCKSRNSCEHYKKTFTISNSKCDKMKVYTAIAIGPDKSEVIDDITKDLKLL